MGLPSYSSVLGISVLKIISVCTTVLELDSDDIGDPGNPVFGVYVWGHFGFSIYPK